MELRRLAKRSIPWVGSAMLLSYMAYTSDLDSIMASLRSVSLPGFFAVAVVITLITFLTDAAGVRRVMAEVAPGVSFKDALTAKATSYILGIINYNAALAGMALFFKRSRGASFWGTLGGLFTMNIADAVVLLMLMSVGLLISSQELGLSSEFRRFVLLLSLGGLGAFIVGLSLLKGSLSLRPLRALREMSLIKPLISTTPSSWLQYFALRGLLVFEYMVSQWLFMCLFAIHVPFKLLVVYVPLTTFIQIVPISICGLGPTQLAMRELYTPFVTPSGLSPEAVVDAYSTASIFGLLLFRILLAWLFMGELSKQVLKESSRDASAGATQGSSEG